MICIAREQVREGGLGSDEHDQRGDATCCLGRGVAQISERPKPSHPADPDFQVRRRTPIKLSTNCVHTASFLWSSLSDETRHLSRLARDKHTKTSKQKRSLHFGWRSILRKHSLANPRLSDAPLVPAPVNICVKMAETSAIRVS